jgi:hypothetical protein
MRAGSVAWFGLVVEARFWGSNRLAYISGCVVVIGVLAYCSGVVGYADGARALSWDVGWER